VIVELPVETAVTTPVAETVATGGALEAHAMTRPASTFPLASFVTAASVVVAPVTRLLDDGETVTPATGTAFTVAVTVAV
jgi:hypothetical protein